jgi:hypothetical protein
MPEPKLIHCVVGSVVGWLLTAVSYFIEHPTGMAALGATVASTFTALAAFEKWRFFRRKRKELDSL